MQKNLYLVICRRQTAFSGIIKALNRLNYLLFIELVYLPIFPCFGGVEMKIVYLVIKVLILFALILFAAGNTQPVELFYLPQQNLQMPLIVALFGVFVVGAIFGIFAMFGRLLSLRAENARLRANLKKAEQECQKVMNIKQSATAVVSEQNK